MMKIRGMFLSLLGSALTLSLNGMSFYTDLVTPDNKHILVMGDLHNSTDPLFDEILVLRMRYLTGFPLPRPIPFILEVAPDISIGSEEFQGSPDTVKYLINLRETQKNKRTPSFAFEFFEPRSAISAFLEGILISFADKIVRNLPASYVTAHYGLNERNSQESLIPHEQAWKKYRPHLEEYARKHTITIGQFLEHLESNETKLKDLAQRRSGDKSFTSLIGESLEKYQKSKVKCGELLKGHEKGVPLAYALFCLFDACTSAEERMCLYDELYLHLDLNTDYLFADIFFLDNILRKLESNPAVCLYAGYHHAKGISKYLVELFGCKEVSSENCVTLDHPLCSSMSRKPEVYPDKEFAPFLAPLLMKDSCWSCMSKKEDLKSCAKCRKAKYCSSPCQTKDWPTHKTVCVAVTQPVAVPVKTE